MSTTNPAPADAEFAAAYAELAKGASVARGNRPTVIHAPGTAPAKPGGWPWQAGEVPIDLLGIGTIAAALVAFFAGVWLSSYAATGKLVLSGLLLLGVGAALLGLAWQVRAP